MAKASSVVCQVCCRQFSQYTCPRCNCPFCSLVCYKSHGDKCTEEFYRENVQQSLKSTHALEKDRLKVVQALKRVHSEAQQSEEGMSAIFHGDRSTASENDDWMESVSEQQFKQIIEACTSDDTTALESLLPDHVLQQFLLEVNRGGVQNLVQPWTPWWEASQAATIQLSTFGTALVSTKDECVVENLPPGEFPPLPTESLPRLEALTKVEASPNLRWQLVNILFCYCYLMRLYNGDVSTDVVECSAIALSLSSCLGASSEAPTSLEETVGNLFDKTAAEFKGAPSLGVLQDVQKLLELGQSAVILALCHFKTNILQAAKDALRGKHKQPAPSVKKSGCNRPSPKDATIFDSQHEEIVEGVQKIGIGVSSERAASGVQKPREAMRKLRSSVQKVWFMMVWANEQEYRIFSESADLLQVAVMDLSRGMGNTTRPQNHGVTGGDCLIEEI